MQVESGQILAVLGSSGSGKTSLLRLISGLDIVSHGTIHWCGNLLSDASRANSLVVPPEKRSIGMTFQEAALFPHLNVLDNVAFGLSHLATPEKHRLVRQWLEKFNIADLANRRIDFLSGGERQRVALARTLAPSPKLVLLDEPFCNIDRLARRDLIRSLRESFTSSKMTVVMVTHDARDALDLGAELLLLLNGGHCVRRGTVAEVIADPGDKWTTNFLQCSFGSDFQHADF